MEKAWKKHWKKSGKGPGKDGKIWKSALKKAGKCLEKAEKVLEKAGKGPEKAGIGLEKALEKAGKGLEKCPGKGLGKSLKKSPGKVWKTPEKSRKKHWKKPLEKAGKGLEKSGKRSGLWNLSHPDSASCQAPHPKTPHGEEETELGNLHKTFPGFCELGFPQSWRLLLPLPHPKFQEKKGERSEHPKHKNKPQSISAQSPAAESV